MELIIIIILTLRIVMYIVSSVNARVFTLLHNCINYIKSTDANKLDHIPQKFAFVCFYSFPSHVPYNDALEELSIHSVRKRRHELDALSFVQVYRSLKSCISLC
jgi:hypothetical protein